MGLRRRTLRCASFRTRPWQSERTVPERRQYIHFALRPRYDSQWPAQTKLWTFPHEDPQLSCFTMPWLSVMTRPRLAKRWRSLVPAVADSSSISRAPPPCTDERVPASMRRITTPEERGSAVAAKMRLHPPVWVQLLLRETQQSLGGVTRSPPRIHPIL